MPQSDTEADTRSISKASIQQDAASSDTAAATSTTALSELRSLLSTLYNPAEWNDGPGPPELRFHVLGDNEWYSDCQAGVKALRDGQYGDAVDRFSQAISKAHKASRSFCFQKIWPRVFAEMLRRRAFVLYRVGRFDDALSDLDLATRFDQASTAIQFGRSMNDSDMYLLAADIQLSLGQYENALASCKVAFQLKSEPSLQQESAAVEQRILCILEQLIEKEQDYHGRRCDPMAHLPLDIVELVMRHGLDSDEYFALKCTWVSPTWRRTLESMPSVWRVYRHNPQARRTSVQKRKTWIRNSGGYFQEIRLANIDSETKLKTINTTWKSCFQKLQILKLESSSTHHVATLQQFRDTHATSYNVNALHLHCYGYYVRESREIKLDLGVLTPINRTTLQELHVTGLSVYNYKAFAQADDETGYSALRILSVSRCTFQPERHNSALGDMTAHMMTPQQDPIHNALRQAPNLENLTIECRPSDGHGRYPQTYTRDMTVLPHLHTLRIPPPSCWIIDIKAPLVRHLAFTVIDGSNLRSSESQTHWAKNGIIPDLSSFAATGIEVSKLISVELMISGGDTKENLLEWLARMQRVERLTITSSGLSRHPPNQLSELHSATHAKLKEYCVEAHSANTANRNLVKMLTENPLLCPRLKELILSDVYTPEAPLISWILARKAGDINVSPISTLSLKHCTYISGSANQVLRRELDFYRNIEQPDISRLDWKELCDDWDETIIANQVGKGQRRCRTEGLAQQKITRPF